MSQEQVLIGLTVAVLCGTGLYHHQWLLVHTKKGQRLVSWFGPVRAAWVWRVALVLGVVFGLLLATNLIRPVRW